MCEYVRWSVRGIWDLRLLDGSPGLKSKQDVGLAYVLARQRTLVVLNLGGLAHW